MKHQDWNNITFNTANDKIKNVDSKEKQDKTKAWIIDFRTCDRS